MWGVIIALSAALAGVMLDATLTHDLASSSLVTYHIAPMMVAPFAGYGFAGAILILAWQRSRPARPLSDEQRSDRA
jgi:zinc transporter ZupT